MVLRNASDAEEVAADTLLTAWRRIDSLRDADRLRPWLLRLATRLALRRLGRAHHVSLLTLDLAEQVSDRQASALDRLPPRMRAVVALHYVADLSVAEVAVSVGRSPNTVKTQLRQALSRR